MVESNEYTFQLNSLVIMCFSNVITILKNDYFNIWDKPEIYTHTYIFIFIYDMKFSNTTGPLQFIREYFFYALWMCQEVRQSKTWMSSSYISLPQFHMFYST